MPGTCQICHQPGEEIGAGLLHWPWESLCISCRFNEGDRLLRAAATITEFSDEYGMMGMARALATVSGSRGRLWQAIKQLEDAHDSLLGAIGGVEDIVDEPAYTRHRLKVPRDNAQARWRDGLCRWVPADTKAAQIRKRANKSHRPQKREFIKARPWCVACGSTTDLSIDHIMPLSKGGPDEEANWQTLCRSCNSRKGVRITEAQP